MELDDTWNGEWDHCAIVQVAQFPGCSLSRDRREDFIREYTKVLRRLKFEDPATEVNRVLRFVDKCTQMRFEIGEDIVSSHLIITLLEYIVNYRGHLTVVLTTKLPRRLEPRFADFLSLTAAAMQRNAQVHDEDQWDELVNDIWRRFSRDTAVRIVLKRPREECSDDEVVETKVEEIED